MGNETLSSLSRLDHFIHKILFCFANNRFLNKFENSFLENFISFQEIYNQNLLNLPLTSEEIIINNLYTTFVFRKN